GAAEGQADEGGRSEREEERRVPGRADRRPREVETMAEVARERAGPAADRVRDVARPAGRRVDSDQRERGGCGDCGPGEGANHSRPGPEAQREHQEADEVDEEPAAVGADGARG